MITTVNRDGSPAATPAYTQRVEETGAEIVTVSSTLENRGNTRTPQMHGREFARAMSVMLDETRAMLRQLEDFERPDLVVHDGTMC
ncbi:hypothetical protein [Actinoplanes sp. NBRC 101535]|uniref:hypothetical protein n=1 Tax=Actinoplanes sp. NBRC 101535 TaxID=3032196 RepID=UPI0024A24CDB|nr:hypothetical protein [Actinoplanes sp. NBRC 101535]GLY05486.1 hypothetical protein Acsp01_58650 [Actinoplanes sp. NBRC 101535]